MRLTGLFWWISATALSLFLVLGPVGIAEAQSYEPEELEFLELINQYRQENGLGPLGLSAPLSVASERHSEDMGTYGFFSHTTQGSSYYPVGSAHPDRAAQEGYGYDTYTAENLAYGQTTAADVFEAWRISSGHNANMLGDYTVIGIGLSQVNGTPYWTTVFGAYDDSSAPSGSTEDGVGTDAAPAPETPAPEQSPAADEPPEASAATPNDEASPGPAATDARNVPERDTAATDQYDAEDRYDAGYNRTEEPAGQEPALAEPSSEQAAAYQYAGGDAPTTSATRENAAGELAAANNSSVETPGAGEEVAETESAETDTNEMDTAGAETAGKEATGTKIAGTKAAETPRVAGTKTAETDHASTDDASRADVAAAAGISTLPDTGGVPVTLIGGAALLAAGLVTRRGFR